MNENAKDTYEIDILDLLQALLKRWWIILVSAIICAAMFLAYTLTFVAPEYTSSVLFYVNNSSISFGGASVSISSGDLSAAKTLVSTYCVILKTRLTLEDVSMKLEEAGLKYSYAQLNGMITSSKVDDTEIFRVTVTCTKPDDACTVANTVAQVLPQKIADVVDGSSVRVVDYAVVPTSRTSPSYTKNTAIGFLVGVVLACGIIALIHLLNDTITSEDWLINTFKNEYPLLASIPDANSRGGSKYYKYDKYSKYGYKSKYYTSKKDIAKETDKKADAEKKPDEKNESAEKKN